jgi:hypothetical protein
MAIEKNLEGQAIVIVPFDTTKPECMADDPETMPRGTFAACTFMNDESQLPPDFAVTKDPLAFQPRTSPSLVLTVLAPNVLEDESTNRWYAVIGVGPAPASASGGQKGGGPLVGSSSIHLNILPAIPLVLGGGALVEGTTALFAAAAIWFGARAIVQTGQLLEQRETQLVTQSVADTMKKEATAENKCTLEVVSTPKADAFDCYEAGRSYGAAACESAIPQYAKVRCSSNCTGPSGGDFRILCPSYKVCIWEEDLKQCQRAPFSDDISSQIGSGCQNAIAKQKPASFCTPKK